MTRPHGKRDLLTASERWVSARSHCKARYEHSAAVDAAWRRRWPFIWRVPSRSEWEWVWRRSRGENRDIGGSRVTTSSADPAIGAAIMESETGGEYRLGAQM